MSLAHLRGPLLAALCLLACEGALSAQEGVQLKSAGVPGAEQFGAHDAHPGTSSARSDIEAWRGPLTASVIAPPLTTPWEAFSAGGDSRLAILLTGEDGGSWLALVEGLKALGVPLLVTRDWQNAILHRVVLVYPTISGLSLPPEGLAALRAFPERGGTLIGFQVLGGGLNPTFGVGEAVPGRGRFALEFTQAPIATGDATVPLGRRDHPELGLGTYAYVPTDATVLARFDTGEAAVVHKTVGMGHTYAVGLDFGDLASRGFNNRQQSIARSYVNQFEPAVDTLLHWIKDRYREGEPAAVTLSGTPDGRELPIMLTHDLDYLRSLRNALEYVDFERGQGIRATYFVQTKYISDWEDHAFLDQDGIALIRSLAEAGMEVGSHTVAHTRQFAKLELGSGSELFPDYQPHVASKFVCTGCSLFGELRVSQFLLRQITGAPPVSFRSGHLLNPPELPQALLATHFHYGSDSTANDLLTHLPVHTHFGRATHEELPVFEFPVSIEDEAKPDLGDRVGAALALIERIIRDEGILVVLIHPNIVGHKLQFERELVAALRERAWFGTVAAFGSWWEARDAVALDVVPIGPPPARQLQLRIDAPQPISGLTLQLPAGYTVARGGVMRAVDSAHAVLGPIEGEVTLTLEATSLRQ